MTGKIFPESTNVYQDQAKILFEYYLNAAENIVNEEERIESEISTLEEQQVGVEKELSKAKLYKWLFAILIIPFFIFWNKEKALQNEVNLILERINEYKKLFDEIFRDYEVKKLGLAYVPIAEQIKYENKSFIVDYSGNLPDSEIKLQLSKQNDLLIKTISDLEQLTSEAPFSESSNESETIDTEDFSLSMQQLNQHDYFGKLDRSLRTIAFCIDDLDVTSVALPLVSNDSNYLSYLNEYATSEIPKDSVVFEVFNTNKFDNEISKFQELNKLKDSLSKDTRQFEEVLKDLMVTMSDSVQTISTLKMASTNKIVFESNKLLYKILKSPYNHYSPSLEATEIERIKNETFNYADSVTDYVPFDLRKSSIVKYNLLSDTWVAEDGSTTNFPFGIHQIHQEIVAPMVQNLMNETRIERMKIYNHIKDQKIDYLNKWHQDTEDFYGRNRAESADLINLMRASLRDYVAAYNTMNSLKRTEDSMLVNEGSLDSTVVHADNDSAEVLIAFESQSKDFQAVQQNFENYMERLKEDIDLKAQKFEHIDYYDALLRDGNSRDTAVASDEVTELDDRRKPLIAVNPLFAKVSEMPPSPSIENVTYENLSLNLPKLAQNVLMELNSELEQQSKNEEIKDSSIHENKGIKDEVEFVEDEDNLEFIEDSEDVQVPKVDEKPNTNSLQITREDLLEILIEDSSFVDFDLNNMTSEELVKLSGNNYKIID